MKSRLRLVGPKSGQCIVLRVFIKNARVASVLLAGLLVLGITRVSGQAPVKLLKDINSFQETPSLSSTAPERGVAQMGGYTYFIVNDDSNLGGRSISVSSKSLELWRTNGTNAEKVIELPTDKLDLGSELLATDTKVFWVVSGSGLWASDGTAAGTGLVKQLSSIRSLMRFQNTVIFAGTTTANGAELWRSDGTEQGTVMVKDLYPGTGNGMNGNMKVVGNAIFFPASDKAGLHELYTSDGTAAGTHVVRSEANASFTSPTGFVNAAGVVYFTSNDKLARTDGTNAGTYFITYPSGITKMTASLPTALGDDLYFFNGTMPRKASEKNVELWRVTAGLAQAELVMQLYEYASAPEPKQLIAYNNKLHFYGWDAAHGLELWQTDGTVAGTGMVADLNPGTGNGVQYSTGNWHPWTTMVVAGGNLYFLSWNGSTYKLTQYNGQTGLTSAAKDLTDNPGYVQLYSGNDRLYFIWNDFVQGRCLWRTDGTEPTTLRIKDLVLSQSVALGGSSTWVPYKGYYYFNANGGLHGYELWRSDGTAAGTSEFKEVIPGSIQGEVSNITVLNNTLYFVANGLYESYLWKSDGTVAGTVIVDKLAVNTAQATATNLLVINNTVMVCASGSGNQWQAIDPSTGKLVACTAVSGGSNVMAVSPDGTYGLFHWTKADSGMELWRTDGTAAGTALVKEVIAGTTAGTKGKPYMIGNICVFEGSNGAPGLWRSDGTAAGTRAITCGGNACPTEFSAYFTKGNMLYFAGKDQDHGWALYKTDGNSLSLLNDPKAGKEQTGGVYYVSAANDNIVYFNNNRTHESGNPEIEVWAMNETTGQHQKLLTNTNGKFGAGIFAGDRHYFIHGTDETGAEPWMTDGTLSGTRLMREIEPGPSGVSIFQLSVINGSMYFMLRSYTGTYDLWKASANSALKNVAKVAGTVNNYFAAGSRMILNVADDATYGNEYFYYDFADEPAMIPAAAQTITFELPATTAITDGDLAVTATATSGLPIYFLTSDPNIGWVNDEQQLVAYTTGTIVITATQQGNDDYLAAEPVARTITIEKGTQEITFKIPSFATIGDGPIRLTGEASSRLPIQYASSDEAVVSIVEEEAILHATGTTTITASQAGDDWYQPAPNVSATITIGTVLGIEHGLEAFKAFPNPTTDHFTIESAARINDIAVLDIYGKTVAVNRIAPNTISLATAPTGIYVVIVSGDTFAPVQMKIIKK
jgi:ELWxxDGT repeat protein